MRKPPTPREWALSLAFALLLGAFIALWFHVAELHRCLNTYQQLFDNNEIIIRPK